MYNPRFPHTVVIKRVRMDENGEPALNEVGEPVYETLELTAVEMFDDQPVRNEDGSFRTYKVDSLPFGYRTATQNVKQAGDVVVADLKIATPMFITPLNYGDRLVLTDFDRTYMGRVVKKQTFNLGSNIWFDEIKN